MQTDFADPQKRLLTALYSHGLFTRVKGSLVACTLCAFQLLFVSFKAFVRFGLIGISAVRIDIRVRSGCSRSE